MMYIFNKMTLTLIAALLLLPLSSIGHSFEPGIPSNFPITEESDLDDAELYEDAMDNDFIDENLQDEAESEEGWE